MPSSACIPSIVTETIKHYSGHITSQGSEGVKKISSSSITQVQFTMKLSKGPQPVVTGE